MSWSFESSESCDEKNLHSNCRKKISIPIQQMIQNELEEEDTREPVNRLTGFVRKYYLKHLNKLLLQNFESYSGHSSEGMVLNNEEIEQCATELEQRALRCSIVVKLYQSAMSRMSADIKKNTEQRKLHEKFQKFKPSHREQGCQTDPVSSEDEMRDPFPSFDAIPSYNPFPSYDPSQCESKILPNGIPTVHSLEKKECTIQPAYETDADHLWPKDYWKNIKESPTSNSEPEEPDRSPLNNIEHEGDVCSTEVKEQLQNPVKTEDVSTKSDENIANSSTCFDDYLSLDERVAMIHGEELTKPVENVNIKKKKKKKLVWRHEKLHHMKVLDSRLRLMSEEKRMRVEQRFKELFFSKPKVPACKTTRVETLDDPLNKQKERMAPWIIKYLNPYYTNGKIANKEIFKSTAKYLSDSLLDKNHLPSEIDVQKSVDSLMMTMSTI